MLTSTLKEIVWHKWYTCDSFCFENYQFSINFCIVIHCKQKKLEHYTRETALSACLCTRCILAYKTREIDWNPFWHSFSYLLSLRYRARRRTGKWDTLGFHYVDEFSGVTWEPAYEHDEMWMWMSASIASLGKRAIIIIIIFIQMHYHLRFWSYTLLSLSWTKLLARISLLSLNA